MFYLGNILDQEGVNAKLDYFLDVLVGFMTKELVYELIRDIRDHTVDDRG